MIRWIFLFSILFFNFDNKDDGLRIQDKKEIKGLYYFYFTARMKGLDGRVEDGYYSTTPS